MTRKYSWDNEKDLIQIVQTLQSGKIVGAVTDTVIGLLAPVSEKTKKELDSLKKRSNKPYLLLVDSKEKAQELIDTDQLLQKELFAQIETLMNTCWPGPLTIIFPVKQNKPDYLKSQKGTIALRVPDHEGLLKVLNQFEGLFSTSANQAGHSIPKTIDDINPEILKYLGCIVEGEQKKSPEPSTIIDASGDRITLVRKGAYPVEKLEQLIGRKIYCLNNF